jgi:hypothetical protein
VEEEKPKALVAQVRKVKSSVNDLNRQLTLGASEGATSVEIKAEFVPLYARPVNEMNTLKVISRKSKREKFKALLLESKR